MNSNEKEVAFLSRVLSYDDSRESRRLKARFAEAHADERCVQRVLRRAICLFALAGGIIACWRGFLTDEVSSAAWLSGDFLANGLSGLGLGLLVSCLVLAGLGVIYRKRVDLRRAEVCEFAASLLEARLGKPQLPVPADLVRGDGWPDRNGAASLEPQRVGWT